MAVGLIMTTLLAKAACSFQPLNNPIHKSAQEIPPPRIEQFVRGMVEHIGLVQGQLRSIWHRKYPYGY